MDSTTHIKFCPRCKCNLPLVAFGRNRRCKDGLGCYCKSCAYARNKEYRAKNMEKVRAYRRKHYAEQTGQIVKPRRHCANGPCTQGEYSTRIRSQALQIVARSMRPQCVRCGCDDMRLLEINHKNGGGTKENKGGMNRFLDIVAERRSVDDLEILCRPCNAIHFLELKFGPLPMKVVWAM